MGREVGHAHGEERGSQQSLPGDVAHCQEEQSMLQDVLRLAGLTYAESFGAAIFSLSSIHAKSFGRAVQGKSTLFMFCHEGGAPMLRSWPARKQCGWRRLRSTSST